MADIERRASRRLSLALTVFWTSDARDVEEQAETGDLSEDGCFLMSPAAVSANEELDIRVQLATDVWLHLRGAVAHRLNCGFGIRFSEMTGEARDTLSHLLVEHRKRNREPGEGR